MVAATGSLGVNGAFQEEKGETFRTQNHWLPRGPLCPSALSRNTAGGSIRALCVAPSPATQAPSRNCT